MHAVYWIVGLNPSAAAFFRFVTLLILEVGGGRPRGTCSAAWHTELVRASCRARLGCAHGWLSPLQHLVGQAAGERAQLHCGCTAWDLP